MTITPPFPYFGGKRKAAPAVWERLGDPYVFIEPFAGSLAVLLARPNTNPRWEIAVDLDGLIVNVWRAIQSAPDELLALDRGPVSEVQLDAWHKRLNLMAPTLTELLRTDPTYFDIELAHMWWAGASSWLGSGWATGKAKTPRQRPHIDRTLKGLMAEGMTDDKLLAISARLANVILLAGDWKDAWRRSVTDSVINRYVKKAASGTEPAVGVFLDPPYTHETGRTILYSEDASLSKDVEGWALHHAGPNVRVVVAGYRSEYPGLVAAGWDVVEWTRPSGYVYDADNDRAADDVLICSPSCIKPTDPSLELS